MLLIIVLFGIIFETYTCVFGAEQPGDNSYNGQFNSAPESQVLLTNFVHFRQKLVFKAGTSPETIHITGSQAPEIQVLPHIKY